MQKVLKKRYDGRQKHVTENTACREQQQIWPIL